MKQDLTYLKQKRVRGTLAIFMILITMLFVNMATSLVSASNFFTALYTFMILLSVFCVYLYFSFDIERYGEGEVLAESDKQAEKNPNGL